jgi:hypothetical protein
MNDEMLGAMFELIANLWEKLVFSRDIEYVVE